MCFKRYRQISIDFYGILILSLLIYLFFFSLVGISFFNERKFSRKNVEGFISSLINPKIGLYYSLPEGMKFCIFLREFELIKCYNYRGRKLEEIGNISNSSLTLIMDRHAMGSFIHASFNPENVIFSELLFGHVAFKNLDLKAMIRVILTW